MRTALVDLGGVPETMLWTLHNRASEAMRPDTYLKDPDCIRIYQEIAYDYERSFGRPDGSHSMRSRMFDDALRPWLRLHPGGTVIELAAGLETQFQRCDDGQVKWYCVDVPEAIAVRQRFLPATERCKHVAKSALDLSWLNDIPGKHDVFVTAQGLLMYFEERDVQRLFTAVVERFPGVTWMFDAIPRWFSKKTMRGFDKTKHYKVPEMPWGVSHDEITALLRGWSSRVTRVDLAPFGMSRGALQPLMQTMATLPVLRNMVPTIAHVHTKPEL